MSGANNVERVAGVRTFKPYPAYKDSGVEWLGEIPARWEARKIKRLAMVRRGASPRPIDDPIYFDEEGEYAWVRISDVTASERYLEQTTQRLSDLGKSKSVALEPGELFLSIAATVGKPVITRIKCCIHDGFVYFIGLRENREYLYYVFSCGEPYKGLGKLGTQLNLNTDTIGDIYLPLPSRLEQRDIVQFLDRETAKIDALVAKKERLIELLQEKRTAFITRAVTKGLDPNVSMKDSGVEWLGRIPAHWKMKRLGWLLNDRPRNGVSPAIGPTGETPTFSIAAVRDGLVRIDENIKFTNITQREAKPFLVLKGDVLLLRGNGNRSLVGRAGIVDREPPDGCIYPDLLIRVRPSLCIGSWFLVSCLNSAAIRPQIEAAAKTSTGIWKITGEDVSNLELPLPPRTEQLQIQKSVSQRIARLEIASARVRGAIDLLTKLRAAIISAAVTGKIDVRSTSAEAAADAGA